MAEPSEVEPYASRRTRLAPSPTGHLHLGNARTFLVNWLLARQAGWRVLLRIDDLDGPRVRRGGDAEAIRDLTWLGLDWDEGPIYQSASLERYCTALQTLRNRGVIYPCVCTRKEAQSAASAPHAEDGGSVYPGTCRDRYVDRDAAHTSSGREPAWRFRMPERVVTWRDGFVGERSVHLADDLGDFIVQKADGTVAYQLATVVDDAHSGVTDVVRGDDLLDSTPRQIALYEALGLSESTPDLWHVPLVVGPDRKRLAKRHGDTSLASLRAGGTKPAAVVSRLASWIGIDTPFAYDGPHLEHLAPHHLLGTFDVKRLPKHPIVFPED